MLQSLLTPLLQPLLRPPLEVSGGSGLALYLDFLTEYIDPRITYSGGANGTRVNSAGLIVASTTPRFDYDPVTLAPLGLLVEEARTNLLLGSEDLTFGAWNSIGVTVSANVAISPSGAADADQISFSGGCQLYQFIDVATLTTYTCSVYAKVASGTGTFRFKWYDATSTDQYGADRAVTTEWERFSMTFTTGVDVSSFNVALFNGGSGAIQEVLFWGAQLEVGSFPTSCIPTTSAAVTRSADSAVMTGTNFSDWFNPAEGTFAPEFTYGGDLVTSTAMSANDNTSNNILEVAGTNSGGVGPYAEVRVGGVVQASMSDGNAIANTTYKTAFRYRANDFSFSHSGRSCVTDAAGTIPSVSQLAIGNRLASSSFNGWIRRLPYYRRGLSDAQLQALSA